jgi:hypothetical protein
MNSLEVF